MKIDDTMVLVPRSNGSYQEIVLNFVKASIGNYRAVIIDKETGKMTEVIMKPKDTGQLKAITEEELEKK